MNPTQLDLIDVLYDACDGKEDRPFTATPQRILKTLTADQGAWISRKKLKRELHALDASGYISIATPCQLHSTHGARTLALSYTLTPKGVSFGRELRAQEEAEEASSQAQASAPAETPPAAAPPLARLPFDFNLDRKPAAILRYLIKTCAHFGKLYCWPSQKKILEYCASWEGVKMSIATLNRWLLKLELWGFITRTCRHRQHDDGTWEYKSTLYVLTGKVRAWLSKAAKLAGTFCQRFGFSKVINNLFNPGRGSRETETSSSGSPGQEDLKGGPAATSSHSPPLSRDENLSHLRELIKKIGG